MPIISMFFGIIIRMYYDDHNPPHFHAEYQGHKGMFLTNGEKLNGNIPAKQQKFISAWAEIHQDELLANWEISKTERELFRIEPLR